MKAASFLGGEDAVCVHPYEPFLFLVQIKGTGEGDRGLEPTLGVALLPLCTSLQCW